ncbi:MAG: 3-hydroxyacyl-CoA dehydrogenase/enoyl-CoA hydratase family protein [Pseudomonadota bacterium]|nr:3-hydroxyacyl-CoA dehydrogenase/enoyl-CoA hydratase family protein [Pseudomonadota bacterium]
MKDKPIRTAAVLGAGVMGAQIAAHLANAGLDVLLFELAADKGDPNANILKALRQLGKLDPRPLASPERVAAITPANYDQHLGTLGGCDLVIEAIAERLDLKLALYQRIAPHLGEDTVLASNTSGLSVNRLAETLPEALRGRFCGMHFFNPPRYMHLVELTPAPATEPRVLDRLETFLVTVLGKGVVRARDTANFIANRIGVFSMVAAMHHADRLGLAPDLVDALTGPAIGRPKSATFRTADVVGLDTLAHVVETSAEVENDPWHRHFRLPAWLQKLIDQGALGQKTGAGVYRKDGRQILVYDPYKGDYRPAEARVDDEVQAILDNTDPGRRLAALRDSRHPQGRFLWAIHRDLFHYAAYWLKDIADSARDLDLAMRWGFGWRQGPFETWQAAGWRPVGHWLEEEIRAGKAMADAALPVWVTEVAGAHGELGSYSPAARQYRGRSRLAVYDRQLYPEAVLGEPRPDAGSTVFEDDAARLWHNGDGIAVFSIKTRMHTLGNAVQDALLEALERAAADFQALVIWSPEAPFSAGFNLKEAVPVVQAGDFAALERAVAKFQRMTQALRDCPVPVVAAVQGLALGGGCEVLLHCDRVVAALESYIGLVEVGVGILPAGGGCKELARRADLKSEGGDLFPFLRRHFETVAMGKVAKSAEEAKQMGFLQEADPIVFNVHELLHVAKVQAHALADAGYRPPRQRAVRVAGRTGIGNLKMMLVNMQEGGFISEHDAFIGGKVAEALCGGDVDADIQVSEDWLLRQERAAFMALAMNPRSQARIEHMLKTGKPLRN